MATREVTISVRVKVSNNDGEVEHVFNYDNADAALADPGIRPLFESGLVTTCTIEREGKHLAGLPFMTWERFENALEPYRSR